MSIIVKLQALLLLTGIGITVYMFFLYKEVRLFEKEIIDIRAKVNDLSHQFLMSHNNQGTCTVPDKPTTHDAIVNANVEDVLDTNVQSTEIPLEADDDVSVTSNEIKDILTNINDESDEDDIENVEQPVLESSNETVSPDVNEQATEATKDLSLLSEQELNALKYDDIRAYLRQKGFNGKGTKAEYIQRILDLVKESATK
jgi:hypothetical protein